VKAARHEKRWIVPQRMSRTRREESFDLEVEVLR
jgi:hypothetical protein